MNIAIVVDDLVQRGGQELLVTAISEIWPSAPIYTTQASNYWKSFYKSKNVKIVSTFIERLPFSEKLNRYYAPFLFHLLALDQIDLSGYDLVLSVSSRYAHRVNTKPATTHVCYMNSPGRMFWETEDYFSRETYGFLKYISFLARPFLALPLSYLRSSDYVAAQKVDFFIGNSGNTSKRIAKYYNCDSKVIYPFVGDEAKPVLEVSSDDYFVVVTRLAAWKRVDIAIKVCTKLGLKLKVIGTGPDMKRLQKMAGPSVEFLGYSDDAKKIKLLSGCKALIQTQSEDFGIVPLEAMACGKPVIAYGRGGVLETVVPKSTGEFFEEQSEESLSKVLTDFNKKQYLAQECINQAKLFSKAAFKARLEEFVRDKYYIMKGKQV